MKIIEIQTQIELIELKTPFITALRTARHVEFVRVRMACANGTFAYGEAPATKAITGEDCESILESIAAFKEKLISRIPEDALRILHKSAMKSSAKAALDISLVSLIAQEQGKKPYEYFGAVTLEPIQTAITISLNNPHAMLGDAKKAYDSGMWILKVKVGADIAHAVEILTAIAKEVPHAKILVDANQAWDVQSTFKFIDAVKDLKIELIEQPVIASDLTGLKTITEYSHIPILADEAVFSLEDVKRVVESKSADMINIKLMKCGGVSKAAEIFEYARKNGIKCMLGSMLEGPYSINIALHLAMAYRDVLWHVDLDSPLLYKEMPDTLDFEFHGCEISPIDCFASLAKTQRL